MCSPKPATTRLATNRLLRPAHPIVAAAFLTAFLFLPAFGLAQDTQLTQPQAQPAPPGGQQGLVIDNSGSMRDKRPRVNEAAVTLVQSSNPQDEAFVVNFNDDYYLDLDKDFTSSVPELKEALERIDARGSTALYDAIIGSMDHLKKGHKDKKVLLVVTDGEDNVSRNTLEKTLREIQKANVVIYTIGLFSDDDKKNRKKATRALKDISAASGGISYFPENVSDVHSICEQVARDIRNQYTLGYYPTNTKKDGTFRTVAVDVIPPRGKGKLTARTRNGYFAPGSPVSASNGSPDTTAAAR